MTVAAPIVEALLKNQAIAEPVKIKMEQPNPIKEDSLLEEEEKEEEYDVSIINEDNKKIFKAAILAFVQSIYLLVAEDKIPYYTKIISTFKDMYALKLKNGSTLKFLDLPKPPDMLVKEANH